jgi:acetaldehyde dehydrogenase (acetylating)
LQPAAVATVTRGVTLIIRATAPTASADTLAVFKGVSGSAHVRGTTAAATVGFKFVPPVTAAVKPTCAPGASTTDTDVQVFAGCDVDLLLAFATNAARADNPG